MKCQGCGKRGFKSKAALAGHQRWCKKWPKSPRYEGPKDEPAPAGVATLPPPQIDPVAAPASLSEIEAEPQAEEGASFYPPLADWQEKPSSSELADLPSFEGEPEAKPAPKEAIFDTTGLWLALGNFIDESLLKDKKGKVEITDAKAKLLDGSLKQLGIAVEAPPAPVVIGYWVPFAVTMFSVFVLPIVLAYVPDLLKNVKMPWAKKPKEPEPEPAVEEAKGD